MRRGGERSRQAWAVSCRIRPERTRSSGGRNISDSRPSRKGSEKQKRMGKGNRFNHIHNERKRKGKRERGTGKEPKSSRVSSIIPPGLRLACRGVSPEERDWGCTAEQISDNKYADKRPQIPTCAKCCFGEGAVGYFLSPNYSHGDILAMWGKTKKKRIVHAEPPTLHSRGGYLKLICFVDNLYIRFPTQHARGLMKKTRSCFFAAPPQHRASLASPISMDHFQPRI